MKKVYICCPANSYTGGPTLAHQLCYILNKNGISAYMWYLGNKIKMKRNGVVHENYKKFSNPYVISAPKDDYETIIVAIESKVGLLQNYKKAEKMIWWLSVDNYFMNMSSLLCTVRQKFLGFKPTMEYHKRYWKNKKYQIIYKDDIVHLVQSEYARLFLLEQGIDSNRIFDLSDYIEDEILQQNETNSVRSERTVLYNPKKGYEYTEKIMRLMPEINWKPIINMKKEEVMDSLRNAKLYIDFGNHPGKDRFPREAVLCGCCIITCKNGAANNDIDIPIDDKYKFEATEDNLDRVVNAINYVMNNYDECKLDFKDYIKRTREEKNKFIEQALIIFGR